VLTCEASRERVAANGRPLGRGGVSRDQGGSPSTREGLFADRTCRADVNATAARRRPGLGGNDSIRYGTLREADQHAPATPPIASER
jgi:hypothetical protein